MSDVLSQALQWLNANPEFSGLVTFIISAAESVAIIGTIVPGAVMMTAIGTLAGVGVIPLWPTIIWAIFGAIVGDGISYWLGRYFNVRIRSFWPFRTHPGVLESGEAFFNKYGTMSVFIGRFVGPVRALVPMVAGMFGMSAIRFTVSNVASAIGWAPAYMLPGILLGAASLELPPDIAVHVILMLLMTALAIMLVVWMIFKIFQLVGNQIDHSLTLFWNRLNKSSYLNSVTKLLKHYNPKKTHGQLVLAFYFLCMSFLVIYLMLYVMYMGSVNIFINNTFFHLFRSLHTPEWDNIVLAISFLGEKSVLLPLVVTLFAWFAITKRWRTAWHVLALGVLSAGSIYALKWFAHSPRPWGLVNNSDEYSFPSGHTTLAVTFYFGIAYLLVRSLKITSRKFIYYPALLIIIAVSISRLYLGVHWFTDIVGGWLVGIAIYMLILLSYNRQAEKPLQPMGIIITILITLTLSYSYSIHRHFNQLKQDYVQVDWPIHTTTAANWWDRQGDHLPLYRINRFGFSVSAILNVQWLSNLDDIKQILLQNGWSEPPKTTWVDVLHRISDVQSTEHLQLVSPLYLGKDPVLVLTKTLKGDKQLVVLRLWNPYLTLQNTQQPLWVGSIEEVPSTYSWLFKHKPKTSEVTPALLFTSQPNNYDIKTTDVELTQGYHPRTQSIILIKPKQGK